MSDYSDTMDIVRERYKQQAAPRYLLNWEDPAIDRIFFSEVLNSLSRKCHSASFNAGWWHDPADGVSLKSGTVAPYAFATKLMLIVSEVAEAMEGHRKSLRDDKLTNRPMAEVELADAMIRIFDLAGAYGYDLGGAIAEKLDFNASRDDHKLEARRRPGGKLY